MYFFQTKSVNYSYSTRPSELHLPLCSTDVFCGNQYYILSIIHRLCLLLKDILNFGNFPIIVLTVGLEQEICKMFLKMFLKMFFLLFLNFVVAFLSNVIVI